MGICAWCQEPGVETHFSPKVNSRTFVPLCDECEALDWGALKEMRLDDSLVLITRYIVDPDYPDSDIENMVEAIELAMMGAIDLSIGFKAALTILYISKDVCDHDAGICCCYQNRLLEDMIMFVGVASGERIEDKIFR